MKRYNSDDILRSLKKVGIKKGDLVHVNPEIFKLGEYENYKNNLMAFFLFHKHLHLKLHKMVPPTN